MGFSDGMQRSLKYTRSLKKKKTYFKDKAFKPKLGKEKNINLPEKAPVRKAEANWERNKAFLEKEKRKSKMGLIMAVVITILLFAALYYLL